MIEKESPRRAVLAAAILEVQKHCHDASVAGGWWHDLHTGESLRGKRDVGNMMMLMVSEIAEANEGHRKGLMDNHLPHRKNEEVELADAIIRILDYAESEGLDVAGALFEKVDYNLERADHKPENRKKPGGKAY